MRSTDELLAKSAELKRALAHMTPPGYQFAAILWPDDGDRNRALMLSSIPPAVMVEVFRQALLILTHQPQTIVEEMPPPRRRSEPHDG